MGKWLCIITAFLLALPGCGSETTPTHFNTFTPLTSIVITSDVVSLPAGVSTQLTATGNFSGLFTRDITSQVTWSSNQPGTADFLFPSNPGRIKALVAGPATITATLDGVTAGDFSLTVNTAVITALTVAPLSSSLPLGLTQTFTAQGAFSDDISRDLTENVTWSSSDETVATISNDLASKGTATALKMGQTTISAQFETFPLGFASTPLTVTAATLSSIAVAPANLSLLSLSTTSFSATGTYSDQSTRIITADAGVIWESSAPAVATIPAANIVNAVAPGTSTIKATLGTISGTSNLTVTGGSLDSIALTLAQAVNGELINGTISRVTARGTFNNGTSRDITGAVTLTAENANASVAHASGNLAWVQALAVTPVTPTKIFAAYGITVTPGESLLTVTAPTLSSVTISPTTLTLASGTSGRLSLTGTFSPLSNQNLAFSADWAVDSGTATVGNVGLEKGRVHAGAAGPSVIRATTPGGQTATTTVTVEERTLQSLTITAVAEPGAMIAGRQVKFTVMANYSTGAPQDVTADATWTIDNSNVAKFSDQLADPGLVVAVDTGTAILTARIGAISDTETLVVQ